MSTGVLWWYPALSAPLVSLSVRVARLQVVPERQGEGVQAVSGRVHHATLGQADRLSLELGAALSLTDDTTERTVRDRLATLEDHLLAGGVVGLAAVASVAWAAVLSPGSLGSAGDTVIASASGLPSAVAGTLAAGARVVLRDSSVRQRREENTVASVSGSAATLLHGVTAGMSGSVLARERHTYPALRLAPDGRRSLIENADGVVYRMRVELVEDVALAFDALAQPEAVAARALADGSLAGPRVVRAVSRSWVRP